MSIIDCTSLWCNGGCGSWNGNGRGFENTVSNISSGCGCGREANFNNCCCRDCRCGSSSNNCRCCDCDCDDGNSFAGGAFCGTINGTFRFF